MSFVAQTIEALCPNGVPFRELSDIGHTVAGLSGKSKADFSDGNARFISYKNVFSNLAIDQQAQDFVKVGASEIQNKMQIGDVVFTGSSETEAEVGMSAVVTSEPAEPLYLNSFCFALRFVDSSLFLPDFSKHLFRSAKVRSQIQKTGAGVTRINISKQRFLKIRIPIPPLDVQYEIARILDAFTNLEAELEAEREARKKQYEFYRNELLSTNLPAGVEFKTLGLLLGPLPRGKRLTKSDLAPSGSIPVYHGGLSPIGYHDKSNTPQNTVMVINTGASSGSVGWSDTPFWCSDACFALPNSNEIAPRFLYHYASLNEQFFVSKVRKAGIPTLASKSISDLPIPVLPMSMQLEIVRVLDALFDLTTNLSSGLPAELNARRKQYEYYRDKLLTFKELED